MKIFFKSALFILLFWSVNSTIKAANIESPFNDISFTTAKEVALVEKKLIFVDFYANWCVPCKWMDETTYTDKSLIAELRDRFIPVKINIDDFDGYTLKEEFNITVLPTVLILDENGRVIKRYEESMSSAQLNNELKNLSSNNIGVENKINISPKKALESDKNDRNPMNINDNSILEQNQSTVKTTNSYRVQVGAFSDYANTEKILKIIYDNFNEPVVVMNSYVNNSIVYKVFVGDFDNPQKAGILKSEIDKKLGINSIVKLVE